MKIGYFVWEYPPRIVGGLGTYAQNICPKMVKMGHDITLFTMNDGNLKTREIMQGIEIHRPMTLGTSEILPYLITEDLKRWGKRIEFFGQILSYNLLSATKFVNELLKKEGYEFDLVVAHDWLSAIAGIMIKRETNLPFVFHIHSTEWGRVMDQGSETIIHLERKAAEVADRIVTVSYIMQSDLINHGFEGKKISVCWNGIDVNKYNPSNLAHSEIQAIREKYGIRPEEKMIFFVGRLTPIKGVIQLVHAMPIILKECPKVKLVIVGKGELEETISELIGRLGLRENVKTVFEFITEEERILHYAACDLAVFPSLYEPFGIVALETMAMAKPVVVGASGISGFREIVIPGETGLHVNGNDPADIAHWGIIPLLKNPEKAKEMGKQGRKRVEEYFSWEKATESTLEIYQQVLKR